MCLNVGIRSEDINALDRVQKKKVAQFKNNTKYSDGENVPGRRTIASLRALNKAYTGEYFWKAIQRWLRRT
jgi:hypothetical protein